MHLAPTETRHVFDNGRTDNIGRKIRVEVQFVDGERYSKWRIVPYYANVVIGPEYFTDEQRAIDRARQIAFGR